MFRGSYHLLHSRSFLGAIRPEAHIQVNRVLCGVRKSRSLHQTSGPNDNSNNSDHGSSHLFSSIIAKTCDRIQTKVKQKSSQTVPELNKIPMDELPRAFSVFQHELHQQLDQYNRFPESFKPLEDIKVIDFINPRISNFPPLLHKIYRQNISRELVDFYQLEDKSLLTEMIIMKLFYKHYTEMNIMKVSEMDRSIDFLNPAQWYPETRKMKRKIIMHVGPTNSGKTYQSLQKLQNAKSGYYAGPLRLLAREIYENFNSRGINCNLVTGEEIIPSVDEDGTISQITSGTIEMVPLNKKMDMCIIDEIQMIADDMRGEAWTSALLGVQAKEVHLCGEERTVLLIKSIVKLTGDSLEINKYERLGKLETATLPLGNHKNLKPGDCVVAFSKQKILTLKVKIETDTKYRVAVIYGALPPEIRSEQAHGFNNGKYDILVASDAIGMGLNLAIKRIFFSTVEKFNGLTREKLSKSALRQIGGRAGRFSHDKNNSGGVVGAYTASDLKYVQRHMFSPIKDIERACVWPTNEVWTTYISQFHKNKSIISILLLFSKTTMINSPHFFLTNIENRLDIMGLLMSNQLYKNLPMQDLLKLSIAPINFDLNGGIVSDTAYNFVCNIIDNKSKSVLDFNFLPMEVLLSKSKKIPVPQAIAQLTLLENSHKLVLLFMWLGQRWPYLFVDQESAHDWKSLIEKRISEELNNLRELRR